MKASLGQILFVEDHEDTRELVTLVLAMNNYKVVAAENCDDALMLARSGQFDPSTPILFYSGAAYEGDKQRAFAAGAQGYLVKPVDNDELIEQVSRLISAAKRTSSVTK